ncbi:hypothetical protein PFTANZ_06591, partial [Plasmodium falciparum Tanzania (2000708)]
MGNTESSSEGEAKTPSLTESHNSARNVLEKIGRHIKDEINKNSNHTNKLKGTLWKARFSDGLSSSFGYVRQHYYGSCSLDHKFHTNIITEDGRDPCDSRNQNRFDENAEAYCNSDKIRGNENNRNDGTACVPFRRQN